MEISWNLINPKKHPDASFESYIWDVENPNKPELTLKPPSMAVCVEYNPKDPNQILSGLHSGQVCFWDTPTRGRIKGIEKISDKEFFCPGSTWIQDAENTTTRMPSMRNVSVAGKKLIKVNF